jgi:hypothetical protein
MPLCSSRRVIGAHCMAIWKSACLAPWEMEQKYGWPRGAVYEGLRTFLVKISKVAYSNVKGPPSEAFLGGAKPG